MKEQLQAGYILSSVNNNIVGSVPNEYWKELLIHLSTFEVDYGCDLNKKEISIIAIIENIISRGKPTLATQYIEEQFVKVFFKTKKTVDKINNISFDATFELSEKEEIGKAFVIIDPRISVKNFNASIQTWETHLGSDYEKVFLLNKLPEITGGQFALQLLQPQRSITSILNFYGRKEQRLDFQLAGNNQKFYEQEVDFAIQLPTSEKIKGLIIEIDGSQHNDLTQKQLDDKRDTVVKEIGWNSTIRIKTNEISSIPSQKQKAIQSLFTHTYAQKAKENYEKPLYSTDVGRLALQFALTPIAVARLEKVILQLIKCNVLDLSAEEWNISIIEQDVPCGFWAVQDLTEMITNILGLADLEFKMPKVNLKVYTTSEFQNCQIHQQFPPKLLTEEEVVIDDVVIDISVLQRPYFSNNTPIQANHKIRIRSCSSVDGNQSFSFAPYIEYQPLFVKGLKNANDTSEVIRSIRKLTPIEWATLKRRRKNLVYFLQNIFRKKGFRPGQVQILSYALERKSVIALLPTGAGKSLTYQLTAFLQPSICLVIDPLKSLMKDQNDDLLAIGIDGTNFINSSIKTADERQYQIQRLVKGEVLFSFISPERLQIEEFRTYLKEEMPKYKTHFSYCVIDEAHCVSEWGHDFRTAYLRLGENARKYCITADQKAIPLLGLTGTASFDVLSDVQRETNTDREEAVVRPKSSERKELSFEIHRTAPEFKIANPNEWQIREAIALSKENKVIQILNGFQNQNPDFFIVDGKETKAGIVFCPHVRNLFGVEGVAEKIEKRMPILAGKVGIYAGALADDGNGGGINLSQIQDDFKQNKLSLLAATKAFGMGINKPNIRYTIHYSHPASIEAFYQEAGRAGRDRVESVCSLIFTDYPFYTIGEDDDIENISLDRDMMISFLKNSFKGQRKEIKILMELLTDIRFPAKTNKDKVQDAIESEFGYLIKINPKPDFNRIYVDVVPFDKGKKYGEIRLDLGQIWPSNTVVSTDESRSICQFVIDYINQEKSTDIPVVDWLNSMVFTAPTVGVEESLENLNIGEEKKISIGFENDSIYRIKLILEPNNPNITEKIIRKAANFCYDASKYIDNLKNEYWKYTNNNLNLTLVENINRVSSLFDEIREEQDTFKAIYRLSILGVITDYTVDYHMETVTLTLKKENDETYLDNLQKYVARYVTKVKAEKVKNDVKSEELDVIEGNVLLRKSIHYLIDFVYSKIQKKRENAIRLMEQACRIGLKSGQEFADFVYLYFDSKYAIPLRDDTNDGKDFSFETVQKYIELTSNSKDDLKHLRGACERLLIDSPDNAAFVLLRSYARYLLADQDRSEADKDFKLSAKLFEEKTEDLSIVLNNLTDFAKSIFEQNNELENHLILLLKRYTIQSHTNWLAQFNQKINSDYVTA